ncbi:quorum sensing histidine kinase QseC [Conservatibacter flavescens]|uniref:Sensor protein QseC n=1 Tax=Conservatibacter flavescens TaxID=28161 RepID=A0A2M8S209_9PAST|nr:quorum sensing histidine kinase QseC [Conservatibacter flavescens]PJG85167.1 two-component system sensor histidine kinase QseC [Conservatibacter flavescens]
MKKTSLGLRLIAMLSIVSLVIWAISTSIAWFQVRKEVNEVFDAQQVLFAERLASTDLRNLFIERHNMGGFRPERPKVHKKMRLDDDALAFAIFTRSGEIIVSDGQNGENFIYAPQRGFSESHIYNDDDKWRIFWLPAAEGQLMVAVGQELDYREDLINEMVFGQMWVWIAGLPFLLALIVVVINRELKPLKKVSRNVLKREPDDHKPLETEGLPIEVLPLVQNLNQFFDRTSTMFLRERRFTSDAAHELRSPLAALRIQAELAQMAGEDVEMREHALQNLTQGIDRASQLIEQLLTLSRLDCLTELDDVTDIDWHKLASSVVSELYFPAQKRQINLALQLTGKPPVKQGQSLLLSLMLRNLVDNAIRYCATGSQVTITVSSDRIIVEDNGGGVDAEDLAKLGQRFFRPAGQNEKGSGLGLSIVHRIAELHYYQVRLENVKNLENEITGLKVTIGLGSR